MSLGPKRRVLVLGDSLTFGDPAHGVELGDTWPCKIASSDIEVFHRGKQGATTGDVLQEAITLAGYWVPTSAPPPFFLTLIQVGIVDCTPRIFSRRTLFFLYLFRLGYLIDKLNRSRLAYDLLGSPWITLTQFRDNIRQLKIILQRFSEYLYFFEIAHPTANLVKNCGDFTSDVLAYNRVLLEELGERVISPFNNQTSPTLILPDGHHLNRAGHIRVADTVSTTIWSLVDSEKK